MWIIFRLSLSRAHQIYIINPNRAEDVVCHYFNTSQKYVTEKLLINQSCSVRCNPSLRNNSSVIVQCRNNLTLTAIGTYQLHLISSCYRLSIHLYREWSIGLVTEIVEYIWLKIVSDSMYRNDTIDRSRGRGSPPPPFRGKTLVDYIGNVLSMIGTPPPPKPLMKISGSAVVYNAGAWIKL